MGAPLRTMKKENQKWKNLCMVQKTSYLLTTIVDLHGGVSPRGQGTFRTSASDPQAHLSKTPCDSTVGPPLSWAYDRRGLSLAMIGVGLLPPSSYQPTRCYVCVVCPCFRLVFVFAYPYRMGIAGCGRILGPLGVRAGLGA